MSIAYRAAKRSSKAPLPEALPPRTSNLLRELLDRNPDTEVFTIETIMRSLGEDRFEANLVFLTLPTLNPLPDKPTLTAVSAAMTAAQMAKGQPVLRLPPPVLRQEISRRSLAVAIHAALPVIEAAEALARPRVGWVTRPICRRIVGVFLFVLASAVALPVIGFHPLQSFSTFVISLGIAEQDGAAVLFGIAVGLLALALMAASVFSAKSLRRKAVGWVKKVAGDLGGSTLAKICEKFGLAWVGRIVTFQWTELLLLWNPERNRRPAAGRGTAQRAEDAGQAPHLERAKPATVRKQPARRNAELIAA